MTMTMRRTQNTRKSLQRRIRRRVLPVIALMTIVAAIVRLLIADPRRERCR